MPRFELTVVETTSRTMRIEIEITKQEVVDMLCIKHDEAASWHHHIPTYVRQKYAGFPMLGEVDSVSVDHQVEHQRRLK